LHERLSLQGSVGAELPEHELEGWQRGNRVSVRVLYELNRRYPALAQAAAGVRRKSA
jgi:hypothetical protein